MLDERTHQLLSELVAHYQPVVEARRITRFFGLMETIRFFPVGFELLPRKTVRLKNGKMRRIFPAELFRNLDEDGLLNLFQWGFARSLEFHSASEAIGYSPYVSVNVDVGVLLAAGQYLTSQNSRDGRISKVKLELLEYQPSHPDLPELIRDLETYGFRVYPDDFDRQFTDKDRIRLMVESSRVNVTVKIDREVTRFSDSEFREMLGWLASLSSIRDNGDTIRVSRLVFEGIQTLRELKRALRLSEEFGFEPRFQGFIFSEARPLQEAIQFLEKGWSMKTLWIKELLGMSGKRLLFSPLAA